MAPIGKLLKAGAVVALGTDGSASSNRLDIWEAGKFAALLQKGVNQDPTLLPVKEVVRMMTVNGMRALGLESLDGSRCLHESRGFSGNPSGTRTVENFLYGNAHA